MKSFAIALSVAAVLSFFAIPDIHAEDRTMNKLNFTSQAFPNNGTIPSEYTCDGANGNPPLTIRNVPAKSRSLALIIDDPDAPRGTWVLVIANLRQNQVGRIGEINARRSAEIAARNS